MSLLDSFWGLADSDNAKRVEAALSLQETLRKEGDVAYVVKRLVTGLQSSRMGARRGFGAALGALIEARQIDPKKVIEEALKQVELCPAKDKKQERSRELALVLCALVVPEAPSEQLPKKLLDIVEKRKWLKEAATRALVSLCRNGCDHSMRAVSAYCLVDNSAVGLDVSEYSPERVALAATCGALQLDDEETILKLDKPLALGARCFPQTHVAWSVAMDKVPAKLASTLSRCVDKHVSSGTLERRGAALVLAAQTALDSEDPRNALSPAVAKCLSQALKSKRSHLRPLALRLTNQLVDMSSEKSDEWRVAVAASLLAARLDNSLVEPMLDNVDEKLYAGVLVDLAYSGQQRALVGLRARSKTSEIVATAALFACLRLVFFPAVPEKKLTKRLRGKVDASLAQKLSLPAEKTAKPLEFWALVADRFGAVEDKAKWIGQVVDAFDVFDSDDLGEHRRDDLASLWILCELRYGDHEEQRDILLESLKAPPKSGLEAAKRACALLGIAHGTETSRPARLVVNNFWNADCARFDIDAQTIAYLTQMTCGEEVDGDEEEDDDEDDDEDDEDDDDDEMEEEPEMEDEDDDEEEEDVMLDAAGLAAYLGTSNEAESALLSARLSHRKSGVIEAQKLQLQLDSRVLDLLERALKRCEDSGEAAIDASAKLASFVRRLEKLQHAESRDLIKRILALTGKLRSYKLNKESDSLREVAAKAIEELAPSKGPPSYALAASHACALSCRAFVHADANDARFARAVSAYADAARDCLGKKRSGVRPSLLKDVVARSPELAVKALVPILPGLIKKAPSAFLKLEAISLAREISSSSSSVDLDEIYAVVAEAARLEEEWKKSDHSRKLVECVLALAEKSPPKFADMLRSSVERYGTVAKKVTRKKKKRSAPSSV